MDFDVTKKYNQKDFTKFLGDFLPADFESDDDAFYFESKILDGEKSFMLGTSDSLDLAVYEFHQFSLNDPRITVTKETVSLMRKYCPKNNVLAVFYNEKSNQWRLSLVTSDVSITDKGNVKQKFSNPKRYSFLLGEGCKRHTPESMLLENGRPKTVKDLEDLKTRFSVETVTKEFYNELFAWYEWAVTLAEFPEGKAQKVSLTNKNIDTHIIRLITRLMFVWFLKQKSLIPEWIFDEKELSEILSDFSAKAAVSAKKGNYYNAVIQNLFFATLNKAIGERNFAEKTKKGERNEQYGIKTLYRDDNENSFFAKNQKEIVELFKPVPFLNGGLFECLDKLDTRKSDEHNEQDYLDGFSREEKRRAFVPNCLFWNKEDNEHEGLISILNRYNFTVEENTPSDVTVALDPELLGKVFENLLGVYNPETQESARKDSGSFYTPREIVDYMVDSGLKEFIREKKIISDEQIEDLFKNSQEELQISEAEKSKLIIALKEIKILDPACGSGAFPMGILNRLVQLITSLDKNMNTYELKLNLIENCIYGIDIQNIAVQISKLRFFISLICEQDKKGDVKDNYGFNPLPNLETKFVCANSLIGVPQNISSLFNDEVLKLSDQLKLNRQNHFNARTSSEKRDYRLKDEELRKKIIDKLVHTSEVSNEETKERLIKEIQELEKQIMAIPKDIKIETIITKDLFGGEETKTIETDKNELKRFPLKEKLKEKQSKLKWLETAKSLAEDTETLEKLVRWNPYDQNSSSPFFDTEWMFGITDGFDIVIGNPPYIQLQKNGGELGNLYKDKGFETFEKTGDIYSLFYEKGIQLLKQNAHLCFITSNKWMRAGYGESTRKFFAKNNPVKLIDFAGVKIFESATVDTNILLIQKAANKNATECCVAKDKLCRNNLSDYIQRNSSVNKFDNSDSWVILSPIEQSIKRKIEAVGTPLKDWDIQINYGIKTGCNEAFIISTEKRDEILANCKDDDERKRTEEIIRPILRGRDIKRYGYDWAGLWLIATFPAKHYDIEKFPALKKYLLKFGKERLEQTGKEYVINGEKITARKKTNNKWFETQDSISYWDDFYKQKIIYPNMTKFLPFVYDSKGYFTNQKCFILTGNFIAYLTAFLNSSLFKYCFRESFPELLGGTRELSKIFFDKISVLKIKEETEEKFQKLVEDIQKSYTKEKAIRIDKEIFKLYELSLEEQNSIGFIEIK